LVALTEVPKSLICNSLEEEVEVLSCPKFGNFWELLLGEEVLEKVEMG